MKKILILVSMLIAIPAFAQDCRRGVDHKHPSCFGYYQTQHRHHHGRPVIVHRSTDWIGPAVVTAISGAVIADIITRNRNETVVIQQPSVMQQPPQCTPWVETQNPNGTVTRTRTCSQ